MAYLIAKKHDERECIAVEVERGRALASLVSYLGLRTLDRGIEILTVTSMEVYGEYKPYSMVMNEAEFITEVFKMM